MNSKDQLDKISNLLKDQNADYSLLVDDATVVTASDGARRYGISLSETTPTLILKIKDKYCAAIICGDTRISFKKLKQVLAVKDISMADSQTILDLTGAKIGEVSLINPGMITLIDSNVLKNKYCYGGSGVAKTTLRINTQDLIRITNAQVVEFTEFRP